MTDFRRDVYCILGLPFDRVTMQQAVLHLQDAAGQHKRCFLSTPNLNFAVACRSDPAFRDSVLQSDLVIADGMPLVWIAWLLNIPIRERVSGSSLMESLRQTSEQPLSVYFFGGPDGAAKAACEQLNKSGSGLRGAGFDSPGFGSVEEMSTPETIRRINESRADFLVVALGARKGQAWIMHNRDRLTPPLLSHLGAVVNFVAGTVKRAPQLLQCVGLEWLWRIKEEPALWRRYVGDGFAFLGVLFSRIIPYTFLARVGRLGKGELSDAAIEVNFLVSQCEIRLQGIWIYENLDLLRECFNKVVLAGKDEIGRAHV